MVSVATSFYQRSANHVSFLFAFQFAKLIVPYPKTRSLFSILICEIYYTLSCVFLPSFVCDVIGFFCHNKKSSYDLKFTIEEPFNNIFTEKVSYYIYLSILSNKTASIFHNSFRNIHMIIKIS